MYEKKKIDVDDLRYLIEDRCLQQHKVAEMMDVHTSTVERWCKKHNIQTQRTGPRSGDQHPDWKGGVKWFGRYKYIYSPDHPNRTTGNYVAEHRLVMEGVLGRLLDKKEVVHHIDGNPENNDPKNLIVFRSNAKHLRHELKGRVPNWTPEGLEKIRKGVLKSASNRKKSEPCDQERVQTTGSQTSKP